jgi:endonuclease/exonuclease/phosphatase family metal-dependent hydrolase
MHLILLYLFAQLTPLSWGQQSDGFVPVEDSFWQQVERTQRRSRPNPAPTTTLPQARLLSSSASSPASRLRVMSFNVYGVPLPGMDHTRYRDIGRLLNQRLRSGTGPDIIFLQEMLSSRTQELVQQAGYPHVFSGPLGSGLRMSAGLTILSRFPITGIHTEVFGTCVSWDCICRKGLEVASVSVPTPSGVVETIYLANTHTNSSLESDFWSSEDAPADIRVQQLQEMRESLWNHVPSDAPLIFAGDFNMRARDPEFSLFQGIFGGAGLTNSIESCVTPQSCRGNTDVADVARNTIDHIFHRNGRSPSLQLRPVGFERTFWEPVNGRRLSDHVAIEIEYEVR